MTRAQGADHDGQGQEQGQQGGCASAPGTGFGVHGLRSLAQMGNWRLVNVALFRDGDYQILSYPVVEFVPSDNTVAVVASRVGAVL